MPKERRVLYNPISGERTFYEVEVDEEPVEPIVQELSPEERIQALEARIKELENKVGE